MRNRLWRETATLRRRRGIMLWTLLVTGLFVAPGSGQVNTVPATQQADASGELQAQRKQRAVARKLHFRERGHARLLDRIRAAIKNESYLDSLRHLQRLIDGDDDRFVFVPNGDAPIGMRQAGEQILSRLNRKGRDSYELLFGVIAAQQVREADRTVDADRYRDVLKRYFHTKAGFAAADRLARLAFDRGDYAAAAATWARLLRDPHHKKQVTPRTKFSLAVAYWEIGDAHRSATLFRQIAGTRFQIAGRNITAADWLNERKADGSQKQPPDDWRVPLGNLHHNRSVSVSAPYPRPVWSMPFHATPDSQVSKVFTSWEEQQSAAVESKAVVNTAIVVNGRVIVRDFEGIHGLDLADGKRRWSFQPLTSLAKSIARNRTSARTTRIKTNPFSNRTVSSGYDLQTAYAGNSTLGTLTSDGRFVFAIDDFKLNSNTSRLSQRFRFDPESRSVDLSQRTNRLVALRIDDDRNNPSPTRKPEWTVGTVPGTGPNPTALSNHFFLGPPLPVGGKLFAVTESKQRLHLVCLNAADGRIFWMQKLALAETPIEGDFHRAVRSCTPSYADGIVVCPTRTGLLIGVDAETGSLRWASYCGDDLDQSSGFPEVEESSAADPPSGFCTTPRIINGRVIYLPTESSRLHCVDLLSGKTQWTIPRSDGEYIAAVTESRLVVVGRRLTRGHSLHDGKELWSAPLGMPSGRGLQLHQRVLVPLEAGRIATLEIETGKSVGQTASNLQLVSAAGQNDHQTRAATPWRPGNLIAAGGVILSSESNQLRAFLPATTVLARAEAELRRRPGSLAKRIDVAEVQLLLGRLNIADQHLVEVLRDSKSVPQQNRAKQMLRELIYARLADENDDAATLLDRLKVLLDSPEERGRYLVRRAEFELRQGNFDGVLQATQQFTALDLKRLFPMPGDESHLVSAASWVPSVIGRIRTRFGPRVLKTVAARIDNAGQQALASNGTDQLEQFLAVYRDWPQAAMIRAELARRLIARGRYQYAEFLLMTNRKNKDLRVRAIATERLAQLWMNRGLYDRAAILVDELARQFADTPLSDGKTTGRQFVERIPTFHSTAQAARRRRGPTRPFTRITVSEKRWLGTNPSLSATLGEYRQRFLTPVDSPFDLLDRGESVDRKLAVIDKATAVEVGSINIPQRHSYPMLSRDAHVGHFFSLGGAGEIFGVSLLEHDRGKPLWKTVPQGFSGRNDLLSVGPAGPTFCSFQAPGSLIVVDPATGRLLWQRNDIDPKAGAVSDPYSGLFGDDRVLVLFAADRKGYTVYDTHTGAVIRRGQLDISSDYVRRMFGRRLAYVNNNGNELRLRIWDPLNDRLLLNEPLTGVLHSTTTDEGDLVVLLPQNRLLVYDVDRGRPIFDVKLQPEETANMTYLRAFRQGGRLFVNLQRVAIAVQNRFSFYASDAFVAAEHIRGDLHAFELKSGRRLWSRIFPQRSILKLGLPNLPFLVILSRIREQQNDGRYTMHVEAVDTETGETLGKSDHIVPARILHVTVSPDNSRVRLQGEKNTIQLDAIDDARPGSPF